MKYRVFVCALAVLCLLVGCTSTDNFPQGMTFSCKDIRVTVPGDFSDLRAETYAKDADFMFGRGTLIFQGLSENKDTLKEMSLDAYTSYVITGNGLSCSADTYGDGYRFSYEAAVGDTTYTYVIATFESASCFWIFQFYCPTENLPENLPEINIILSSVSCA